jgi:two-component system sensor histidine kinase MprB
VSLRGRVTLAAAAAVTVALALTSLVVYAVARDELTSRVDASLRDRVPQVMALRRELQGGSAALGPGASGEVRVIQVPLPLPPLGAAGGFVQVVSKNGDVLRPAGQTFTLPVTQRTRALAAGSAKPFFNTVYVRSAGKDVRVYSTTLGSGLALMVARPLDETDATLRRIAIALGLITLAGAGLGALLGRAAAGAVVAPVARLTETAERVAQTHDLGARIDAPGTDEVGRLAASFNAMLATLERSFASQRQLVADASHELRTPLTSLRTNIEVLQRADRLPADERDRLLADVVGQLDELGVLVADVVELARGNEADEPFGDVRLDDLVAGQVARARRFAPQLTFTCTLEPCVVRAAPRRLERAVANLLDNAAKWSPPGEEVEVAVRGGEVAVRDHGPGIAEADREHVFERFWRAPAARGMPGSGLGLSIVRQVAELHDGAATAEAAPGGGALLRLRVPVA